MILTGDGIREAVERGEVVIEPFDATCLEPNSYRFRIGPNLLCYTEYPLDPGRNNKVEAIEIPATGLVLSPRRLYLGHTLERMGSVRHAATLYATRSVATLGLWIQISAELGHTGAAIPWTLEIRVCHPVRVYPEMAIGKLAFWCSEGPTVQYRGRYEQSVSVVPALADRR